MEILWSKHVFCNFCQFVLIFRSPHLYYSVVRVSKFGNIVTNLSNLLNQIPFAALDQNKIEHKLKSKPQNLSQGEQQRVSIARALINDPVLILADEPTSALDVVVQRQIMQTLTKLQQKLGASVLLVGHDMGLMAQFAERIGIMYQGNLVEVDTAENIFTKPQHPYTKSLISSIPSFERKDRLELQSENKVSSQN